ncbi:MAG: branched-chain amino acid ABC transporter permease [Peptococcaceae bacterium]|jgi:branched-chain amino acid transport system permease protein|nr:branched-chain amino acid ABC transporter permease [Peptococcaceae bacterium]
MFRKPLDLGLVVLIPVLFALAPLAYNNQLLLFNAMVFLALAQGINIIYGFTGYLPFGYVGFFGAGAYGASLTVMFLHLPAPVAVLLGGLTALALGLVLSPLLRLSGVYFAIASLAASEAVYYVIANPGLVNITKGPYGVSLDRVYSPEFSYLVMAVIVGLVTAVVVYLKRSHLGLSLKAVRDDPLSSETAGIDVKRQRMLAWSWSALFAGLTGAVFAWQISVFYPGTVFDPSISIFAIVFTLFGGAGTVLGPILGTVVLYGVYNLIGITEPQYFQLIYGVLIMVLVLFLPEGIVSLLKRGGANVL